MRVTPRDAGPDAGADAATAPASSDAPVATAVAGTTIPALPTEPAAAEDLRAIGLDESDSDESHARWADDTVGATALTWVDLPTVARGSGVATLEGRDDYDEGASLLKGARLRRGFARPGVVVPFGILVGLVGTYSGATLLWPLHEVTPTVQAVAFETTPAPAAALTWPPSGSAAVGVQGIGSVASTTEAAGIASITKVVSVLMVLDRLPLAVGEQGPEYSFTRADSQSYWAYRRSNQSALDVPVGGTLTQYQMLQGTMLGSANNYIDRLVREIWGSERAFADAAEIWLRDRGLEGITVVTPSGFDERNRATPDALVKLAERAMQNPVFAEIVGTPSVDLPGAGTVTNTNGMMADAGVVGIKTGTLEFWNLLTAKNVTVGDTTVQLYAAVLGQDGDEQRLAATRSILAETEAALQAQPPAVPAGTVVGEVETIWGTSVEIVTEGDAAVVLWNSAVAEATAAFDLGDRRESGDAVGTLTTVGPLNTVETALTLADDVDGPSPWWRLTHPFELFGINEDTQ